MVMDSLSPQSVGREFVRQYYTLLNQAPLHLHRFYSQDSSFVHGGLDNDKECQPVHGQQEIHQRIMQLNFRDCKAKIRHVDAHATLASGVVVQVSGELSNNGQPMRRFMQTFVLAPQSPKKYYVHNDIFRYQDEVFSDDEIEEETDEVTTENEKNMMAISPDSTTVSGQPQHQAMIKPVAVTSVGNDGIPNVSINASVTPALSGPPTHPEIKKEVPQLNGGEVHVALPPMDGPGHIIHAPAPDLTASTISAPTPAPGMGSIRPQPDVTTSTGGPQQHLNQPVPQRGAVQPQKAVAPQAAVRTVVNHVEPEPEPELVEENAEVQIDEKEQEEEEEEEEVAEFEEPEKQQPQQPQQQAEPASVEPRNQGPPTYANLVKSGATMVPSRGSLPSAGFGKPSAVTTAQSPAPSAGAGIATTATGSQQAGATAPATAGRDKELAQGFSGQGQQQGSGKFRGGRQSLGGGGRGGNAGSAASTGNGRERERFPFKEGEGLNQDGQERRRTMGGGGSGGAGSAQYPDTQQLFVGNLPHNCTEQDLEILFGKYGKVAEVRISSKGIAQSKTTASGQGVPNFGFVVFEEERGVSECLKDKPIHLSDGHRLNVETKKNKPMMRSDGQAMGSLSAPGGSNQNRGSQEHLGNAGRGSDRPRGGGGSRGGSRGGRSEGGGRGGGMYSGGSGQRGGLQSGGGEYRGGPPGQRSSNRGGPAYSRGS